MYIFIYIYIICLSYLFIIHINNLNPDPRLDVTTLATSKAQVAGTCVLAPLGFFVPWSALK